MSDYQLEMEEEFHTDPEVLNEQNTEGLADENGDVVQDEKDLMILALKQRLAETADELYRIQQSETQSEQDSDTTSPDSGEERENQDCAEHSQSDLEFDQQSENQSSEEANGELPTDDHRNADMFASTEPHSSELLDSLNQSLDDWMSELRDDSLYRIENRLEDIIDWIQSNNAGTSSDYSYLDAYSNSHHQTDQTPQSDSPSGQNGSEEIATEEVDVVEYVEMDAPYIDIEAIGIPEAVDPDLDDVKALHEALALRDECIITLLKKLQTIALQRFRVPELSSLETVPVDLEIQLNFLKDRLTETLSVTEVELALERAQLSREVARLKELMMNEKSSSTTEPSEPESRKKGVSRWKKALGFHESK